MQSNPPAISTKDSSVHSPIEKIAESPKTVKKQIDTSTYDHPLSNVMVNQQRQQLIRLAHEGLFEKSHLKLLKELEENQKNHFERHRDLHILAYTKGDLFGNKENDYAYIAYDNEKHQIEIILFDQNAKRFKTLYRDVQVSNLLKKSDCYYTNWTIDYSIAAELIYQEDYIRSSQSNYLIDEKAFSIDDISKNSNFDLQRGCLSKGFSKNAMNGTLCIPTSSVYANYQCLKYNKTKEIFEIYFSQEFAD